MRRLGPLAPNYNIRAERFVQSVRQECLDHFLVCGELQLRQLLEQYFAIYPKEFRPIRENATSREW